MVGGSRVAEEASPEVAANTLARPAGRTVPGKLRFVAPRGVARGASAAPRRSLATAIRSIPWPIVLITVVAGVLRFTELTGVGANYFYDAAVRSMSLSWHNFLFGAFDPAAMLSIDKPPLDLWLQVASVEAFGWGRVALALPEALAGTLAVPILYGTIRRAAGRPAALAAAVTLAVLPESVLTSRSDTMDSLMMMLVVASLWLTLRSCTSPRRRWVVLAGTALGLAFDVKLLEALIAAPALVVLYLLGKEATAGRKLGDLAIAGISMVAVGLAWPVAVSLAPGSHPWAVGSTDGTVWNAMFVFNGIGRSVLSGGGPTLGGPGPFRLLQSNSWHYDVLFGCVLVSALALGLAATARWAWVQRARPRVRAAHRFRLSRALATCFAVWIAVALLVFDTTSTVHPRYLEALAPALAGVIGFAAAALAGLRDRAPVSPVISLSALVAALVVVCAYTVHFKPSSLAWGSVALILAVAGAGVIARVGGGIGYGARWLMVGMIVACVMIFPIHESISLVGSHTSDSLGLPAQPPGNVAALSNYLGPRTQGARYELASDDPTTVATLIIRDQRPILPLTSFGGRPLVDLANLKTAVQSGAVRYALVSPYPCGTDGAGAAAPAPALRGARRAACTPAALWIRERGLDVTAQAGLVGRTRLYFLSPYSAYSGRLEPIAQLSGGPVVTTSRVERSGP